MPKKLNALTLLADQHRQAHLLIDALLRRKPRRLERLFRLSQLLSLNMALKQRLLYPVIVTHELDWSLGETRQEQLQIRRMLCHLLGLEASAPMFGSCLRAFRRLLIQQFRGEEECLFPQVRSCLNSKQLAAMGTAMTSLASQLSATDVDVNGATATPGSRAHLFSVAALEPCSNEQPGPTAGRNAAGLASRGML